MDNKGKLVDLSLNKSDEAEKVIHVKTTELTPFEDNPFHVNQDEGLNKLIESIREFGVILPLIVRPQKEGGYEIISGHRRVLACKLAGIENIPAFVRYMDRDTAVIALVDSNLHREHILPSEKAFAYKMKLEAIKHQGKRANLTSDQLGQKYSVDIVAENSEDSKTQVQRYIRLTELISPILKMVDEGQIAFSPAVEISYLTETEQSALLENMQAESCTPSHAQAIRMKKLSQEGRLNTDVIYAIMQEEKPNQQEQIKLRRDRIKNFFPHDYSAKQIEDVILKLLEQWHRRRERDHEQER
ncbi:MAG TPA: ParB/RepB/Spo0J family partition protein [Clostridia bacterium]|nr:ParB/RepB/Spo0J family partition protein [Clostridia bacterium]